MKNFFLKSVLFVSFFSIIRFFLNLTLASLLLPSDYGVILLPLIIFSFFDLLLEGGLHAGIIKFNASKDDLTAIVKKKFIIGILGGPLVTIFILILGHYSESQTPFLIVVGFLACSLIKITNYFSEAKLIAEGKYIQVESMQFLVSIFLYAGFIYLIPYSSIPGYYFLIMFNILLVTLYGAFLNIYLRQYINLFPQSTLKELKIFSASVIQSNFIFSIGARIDEISAAALINSSTLGLYSKAKELGMTIGMFSSKIISRPWYYIACNIKPSSIKQIYFSFLILSMLAAFLMLNFLVTLVSFLITLLGPNWTLLSNFSIFIVLIFIMYFYVQFTNATMLALGLEREQLSIDRWIISIKISIYLAMTVMISFNYLDFDIKTFLLIEVFSRFFNLFLQIILLVTKANATIIMEAKT